MENTNSSGNVKPDNYAAENRRKEEESQRSEEGKSHNSGGDGKGKGKGGKNYTPWWMKRQNKERSDDHAVGPPPESPLTNPKMTLEDARFRKNVLGIVICEDDPDLVLGCERLARNGWQLVQGGIDAGEDVTVAAWRELYEEIGIPQPLEDEVEKIEAGDGVKSAEPYTIRCLGVVPIEEGFT